MADAFAKGRGADKAWEQMIGEEGMLKDTDAGTWWMQCRMMEKHCVEIGDHTVMVGEVLSAASYASGAENAGVVYVEGSYRRVGEVLSSCVEGR